MAAGAVDNLLERFEKDAWFGKPQGRDLDVVGLDAWAKKEMLALGGPLTTHITYRTFVRVAQKFEGLRRVDQLKRGALSVDDCGYDPETWTDPKLGFKVRLDPSP